MRSITARRLRGHPAYSTWTRVLTFRRSSYSLGMNDASVGTAAGKHTEVLLEQAKAAGLARLEEARNDSASVAWAERTADMLEQRARDRAGA